MLILTEKDKNEESHACSMAQFPSHFAQGPRDTEIKGITHRWKVQLSTTLSAENRADAAKEAMRVIPSDPAAWFLQDGQFKLSLEPETITGIAYRYPWQLWRTSNDTDQDFMEKRVAVERVLKNDRGWTRTGLLPVYEEDANNALCIVRIIPDRPVLYCEAERTRGGILDLPLELLGDGTRWMWAVNHGFGHAIFAMHDMYADQGAYYGCMGGWSDGQDYGYVPSQMEIESAKLWLRAMAPIVVE
jgi:hypothetical protein